MKEFLFFNVLHVERKDFCYYFLHDFVGDLVLDWAFRGSGSAFIIQLC